MPNYLAKSISKCITLSEDVLNTSDHLPVKIAIDIGSVPRGCTKGITVDRVRWDKLDYASINHRYRLPLEAAIRVLIEQTKGTKPFPGLVDDTIEKLINHIRTQDRQVPRSYFKKNIKSFWCEELDILKRDKIEAFRLWCEAGRPIDADNL